MREPRAPAALVVGLALVAACAPAPVPARPQTAAAARIVAAERGRAGVYLALVAESGERLADITQRPLDGREQFVVDTQPAWSPDGSWLAFASNRDRAEGTSLWLVAAAADSEPVRLTSSESIDRDPTWSPDGEFLIFSSNRSGSFDLWRLPLGRRSGGWRPGQPVRLTFNGDTDEVTPDISPDGTEVVYAVFDRRAKTSTIWWNDVSGRNPRRITAGPLEQTPTWHPDGQRVAYSAPSHIRNDLDIFEIRKDGTRERLLLDEPLAHQSAPAWSPDGRFLFAVAVLRSEETGAPFFWSVVAVDSQAPKRIVALHDPASVVRVSFALAPKPPRPAGLAALPAYDRAEILRGLRDQCETRPAEERPPVCKSVMR